MQRIDGTLIFSPSDLQNFVDCEHLTRLQVQVCDGEVTAPIRDDDELKLLQRKGSLFGILHSGDFEDVRLDEPFDLRERGTERFVAFKTDRSFKLMLNDNEVSWGKPVISGSALYALAKVGDDDAVFQEIRGGEDRLIEREELIDLNRPGVERFITAPRPGRTFEIIVNARPHVVGRHVTFEEIVQLAFPGEHGPTIVFSMTYRHAAFRPPAGELGRGGSVDVKKGTVFNVTRTDKS
jgi:hypothetical protein